MATSSFAGPAVYRCETAGKVAYSDTPCVGATVVDITPTQGMDKMSGKSRKSYELQRADVTHAVDDALKPLTDKSRGEMEVMRRRVNLTSNAQQDCARLDARLPALEQGARDSAAKNKSQADFDLYEARKRYFDLKC